MTPAPENRDGVTGWWKCRAIGPDGSVVWVAQVQSSQYTDDVVLELPAPAALDTVGDAAVCFAAIQDGIVTKVAVTPRGAPKAPELWFMEVPESDAKPPAVCLIAFSGHGVAAGSLIDGYAPDPPPVRSEDQLGAVRWYPATGEVDQIYVSPTWRRHSIASALIAASATLAVARGWPRLWGDGQRTALGDKWRAASPWAHRAAELTHLAAPMTPPDQR